MPNTDTKKIYMLIRTVSDSRIKPNIDTVYSLITQKPPPLDPSYFWYKEDPEAPDETPRGTLWARVPKNWHDTSCKILDWCSHKKAQELLSSVEVNVSERVAQEVSKRFRIGKLLWESGDERGAEYAHAYLHVRSNEDREAIDEWDEERHIWWDIDHVDIPAL